MNKLISVLALLLTSLIWSSIQANGSQFIDDASLDIKLRNVYFNRDGKNANPYYNEEWVQGVMLNFSSGYAFDTIGINASTYNAFSLHEYDAAKTNLPVDANGDSKSINKLGIFYLKAKFGDDQLGGKFKHGRMPINTHLLQGSGSRVLPSSYTGTTIDTKITGFDLYINRATKTSQRNSNDFDNFLTSNGQKIDDVITAGGAYEFSNGLGFNAAIGRSKDYLKQQYFKVYFPATLSNGIKLNLDARVQFAQENGSLYANKGYDSSNTNLNMEVNMKNYWFALAYTQISGDRFDWFWSSNEHGALNASTYRDWSDFVAKDEKIGQVSSGYDFAS